MNTFLITMAVIHLLVAGARLASKPGESRGFNPGAGALLVFGAIHLGLAIWALNLLIGA